MEPLTRSVPFRAADSDGTTLEGYAAVFDSPTEINSWEGRFTEVIEHGAFAGAVRQQPPPVLQFDHGTHPWIGSLPIGAINTLREDSHGLYVNADLHQNFMTEPIRDAIKSGSISGMSFKFTVPDGGVRIEDTDDGELRTLTNVTVHELGPVVWPAYKETSVGVRARELAQLLSDDPDARRELIANLLFDTSLAVRPTDESPAADAVRDEPEVPAAPVKTEDVKHLLAATKVLRSQFRIKEID